MKQEARYNTETQRGTFAHRIHHGEVVHNAKVINDAPSAIGQNLAATKGTNGAKKLLAGRYKKS